LAPWHDMGCGASGGSRYASTDDPGKASSPAEKPPGESLLQAQAKRAASDKGSPNGQPPDPAGKAATTSAPSSPPTRRHSLGSASQVKAKAAPAPPHVHTSVSATVDAEASQAPEGPAAWWSVNTDWIKKGAVEILGAYNFFFEHIGIRKGWRTPPFKREDVQEPFMASAEVVAVVRGRLDQEGRGMVLRQLEGSAMDFLWGWSPDKPPASTQEILQEFFRGLVFATLSDANGLVEGLDVATVEYYVNSHPIIGTGSTVVNEVGSVEVNTSAGAALAGPKEDGSAVAGVEAEAASPSTAEAPEMKVEDVPATSVAEAEDTSALQAKVAEPQSLAPGVAASGSCAGGDAPMALALADATPAAPAPANAPADAAPAVSAVALADAAPAAPVLALADGTAALAAVGKSQADAGLVASDA